MNCVSVVVGDVHCTPEEIGDCEKLIDLVVEVAQENKAGQIVFLGDQHHTHGVVRLEVIDFWKRAFHRLVKVTNEVIVLVGNHDMLTDTSSSLHSMSCYEDGSITIVDSPQIIGNVLHLPYYHYNEDFVDCCNQFSQFKDLVCHQSFDTCRYDNGAFVSNGVDHSLIPQTTIIAGHIHTTQELKFGNQKIYYCGSPRWRNRNDENKIKWIYVVERDVEGALMKIDRVPTDKACRAIYKIKVIHNISPDQRDQFVVGNFTELKEMVEKDMVAGGHRVSVDVEGPPEWVDQQLAEIPPGAIVRAFRVVQGAPKVRESMGIEESFKQYLGGFQGPLGTPTERLTEIAKERLNVA